MEWVAWPLPILFRGNFMPLLPSFSPESSTYLDEALANFSGYLTIDEVYDGPFGILFVVDNRRYHRLAFRVLDHKPTRKDVLAFLTEFKEQLDKRGLKVVGITTDGSSLYPKVLKKLWPNEPQQSCEFHVKKELVQAVLRALAQLRKQMKAKLPNFRRGRPSQEQQRQARRLKRGKQRVAELFKHRHLFVRHHLSTGQRKLLRKRQRGQRQLRALRQVMDEGYRLCDRRCQRATALRRLDQWRKRVRRLKRLRRALAQLNSPNLDKALVCLDHKDLGATSNAVERANRRFRKAQKSIYRVRTLPQLRQRLALDLYRELGAAKRAQTLKVLHRVRSRPTSAHL